MKVRFAFSILLHTILVSLLANSFLWIKSEPYILFGLVPVFLAVCIFAGAGISKAKNKRHRACRHGTVLLYAFYISMIVSTVWQIVIAVQTLKTEPMTTLWSVLLCVGVNFLVFWDGILCVYLTSSQLGLKWRLIGLICGLIPVANLIVLFVIIRITTLESLYEMERYQRELDRKEQKLCATQYPILLVHGVFFRDFKFFNYWGRIPETLEMNGASIFYGNHSSAESVADSAAELQKRIGEVLAETGAQKVNIIAHSKGGLDCRYAIAFLGVGDQIASLTTINTPHRGCQFADYLLEKIPEDIQKKVEKTYNTASHKLGDPHPDFMAAVRDLTASQCLLREEQMPTPEGIFCQSVGSVLTGATQGKFPLNYSYLLVDHFSGDNDGLVDEDSFSWGEKYTLLKPTGKRGISHGDMIDLNRENIEGFDVREFYVNLANDLKNRGL